MINRSDIHFARVRTDRIYDKLVLSSQMHDSWCGPALVQAVLAKHGIDRPQFELAIEMGTTDDKGTKPESIVDAFTRRKIAATRYSEETISVDEAMILVRTGSSAILPILAYRESHYLALVGESQNNWFFADPYAEMGLGYLPKIGFGSVWQNYTVIIVPPPKTLRASVPIQRIQP